MFQIWRFIQGNPDEPVPEKRPLIPYFCGCHTNLKLISSIYYGP